MSPAESIQQRANESYASRFDAEQRKLIAAVDDFDSERAEEATEELREQPLSFSKLTTHHHDQLIDWEILLSTGGPAERIIVTTDYSGQVEGVDYQFQDWFEPWTSAEKQNDALLTAYAEIIGYYEDDER